MSEEGFLRREGLSRINDVQRGELFWGEVDLLLWDTGLQGPTIRLALEDFGLKVNLYPIGQARHVVRALSKGKDVPPYVILAVHGDGNGLPLPELGEELAAVQPFHRRITPQDIASFVDLPGAIVVSLGCDTGTDDFANAFLSGGVSAYIAPKGYPLGYASTLFSILLFYEIAQFRELPEALARINKWDEQMGLWKLWKGTE